MFDVAVRWVNEFPSRTTWGLFGAVVVFAGCQSAADCGAAGCAPLEARLPASKGASEWANAGSELRAEGRFLTQNAALGAFTLFAGGQAAPIFVSAGDYAGVTRAAKDLQADVKRVSGVEPALTEADAATGPSVVVVGTVGHSPLIDGLVTAGKLDATALTGKWEKFVIQTVDAPMAGVEKALVVAGSDKRGTIYGIYELSEEMGVSPWYDLADVPPAKKSELYVLDGQHTLGEPAVKYRGFFINDEAPGLTGWYAKTYGNTGPGFNSEFYVRVFELLLRLKGNYLWPAMWGKSFNADDPENPRLADEYGVVMGTSHHEPMTRSEQEWYDAGHTADDWRYDTNGATLRSFWEGGIERMGDRETLVTVGMRGSGDIPNPSAGIPLLEQVVSDQRTILGSVTGKPVATIPQVWTLYKEVQTYYDEGMEVPDDVTLIFADDNWGNVRRLPQRNAAPRPGGYGVYYHYDYVGGPRSYRWLNTNPIPRVWEQMRRSYSLGARQVWIVNVGDIKPMEYPLHFFMDMAWNPESWTTPRLVDYPRRWAEAQFGPEHAEEIAHLVSQYSKFNGRRKPELLSGTTYSVENFREADTVVDEYNALVAKAEEIDAKLPEEARSAYFQLVLFPIRACANLNEMYVSVGKNDLYNSQGRVSTNAMADRVQELFDNDAVITEQYHSINDGKWDQLMTQTHISYTSWDNPEVDVVPTTKRLQASGQAAMGVAVEGSRQAATTGALTLPELTVYYPEEDRRIEVFNRGAGSFDFTATSDKPYVTVTPASGTVTADTRLGVTVDWAQVPMGDTSAAIAIAGGGATVTVNLPLRNPETPRPEAVMGFVESNGYVSIDASHFTERVDGADARWIQVPDLGRTGSAVVSDPPNAAPVTPSGNAPHLDYQMYLWKTGQVTVDVYLSPSLPVHGTGLKYAVGFDGGQATTVDMHTELPANFTDTAPAWEKWVSDNVIVKSTTHTIAAAGEHALNLWMVDPGVVVQKIVVKTGAVPASYLGPPARLPLNVETEVIAPEVPPGDGPVDPTTSDDTATTPTGSGTGTAPNTNDPTTGGTNPGTPTNGTSPTPTSGGTTTPDATIPGTPPGQPGTSTSPSETAATTSAPLGTDGAPVGTQPGSDGCGCSVPGRHRNQSGLGLAAFAAFGVLGLTRLRRRSFG